MKLQRRAQKFTRRGGPAVAHLVLVRPMSTAIRLITGCTLASLFFGAESIACSVRHVATAREITRDADVILLVRVPDKKIEQVSPIKMTVLAVLKGNFRERQA